MRLLAAAALVSLAAGCTPMQWVKADARPEEFERDMTECRQQAFREAHSRFWYRHPIGPTVFRDSLGRPFVVWPTGPFNDPFSDQFMEESRLTDFCMRAKGWDLVPAPKKDEKLQS